VAIKHKRKNSTGYTWQSGDLVEGQIGLNIADGTLHFKKTNNDVVTIGAGGGSGIASVSADTAPQLGGDLDVNGKSIISASNGNIILAPNGTGIVRSDKSLQIQAQGELRLADSDSSHYVAFKSPATVTTNRIWTLPSTHGTSGQFLSTNGSGTLSWASAAAGPSVAVLSMTGNGVNVSGTTYRTVFSELTDPSGIVSLEDSDRRFVLAAGTYIILSDVTIISLAENKYADNHLLYNVTSSTTLVNNIATYQRFGSTNTYNYFPNRMVFTLAGTTSIEYRFDRDNSFYLNSHLNTFYILKI
jgi:hypothetical protein